MLVDCLLLVSASSSSSSSWCLCHHPFPCHWIGLSLFGYSYTTRYYVYLSFHRTTIIEALKYAITGTLPPGGSKAGQNFVHDPRAIGSSLVKAQVKLRFTSRSSQSMVVVRSTCLSWFISWFNVWRVLFRFFLDTTMVSHFFSSTSLSRYGSLTKKDDGDL